MVPGDLPTVIIPNVVWWIMFHPLPLPPATDSPPLGRSGGGWLGGPKKISTFSTDHGIPHILFFPLYNFFLQLEFVRPKIALVWRAGVSRFADFGMGSLRFSAAWFIVIVSHRIAVSCYHCYHVINLSLSSHTALPFHVVAHSAPCHVQYSTGGQLATIKYTIQYNIE